MSKPLEGLLVVALEQAVAAPYCSSRLADAGARVIKIERAEGDFARKYDSVVHGESAYFVWLNRGKESLVLDIKQDDDKTLLERLLAKADVFIQNLSPGAAMRAGFGSDDLRTRYPRLITCDISGYGEEGDYRDMRAYDLLVQAETGLASITGTPESPGRVGVSVCDIAAGMSAYQSVLEALLERGVTGKGKSLAVSLFDGMADWMTVPLLHFDYGGKAPERVGLRHPSIAPYAGFETGDGDTLVISIQNEREWARLAGEVLGEPSWAEDGPYKDAAGRIANRESLEKAIGLVFKGHSTAELRAKLMAAKIAFGQVNGVAELSNHSALRRVMVETETGPVEMPAPPVVVKGGMPELGPVPSVGQHTAAIRREFCSDD